MLRVRTLRHAPGRASLRRSLARGVVTLLALLSFGLSSAEALLAESRPAAPTPDTPRVAALAGPGAEAIGAEHPADEADCPPGCLCTCPCACVQARILLPEEAVLAPPQLESSIPSSTPERRPVSVPRSPRVRPPLI